MLVQVYGYGWPIFDINDCVLCLSQPPEVCLKNVTLYTPSLGCEVASYDASGMPDGQEDSNHEYDDDFGETSEEDEMESSAETCSTSSCSDDCAQSLVRPSPCLPFAQY